MLDIDCIEKCICHLGDADLVWHEFYYKYEFGGHKTHSSEILKSLEISEEEAMHKSWTALELWKKASAFAWVWAGLFRIEILKNIRFCARIKYEDLLFGPRIFINAKKIRLLPHHGVIYRVRENSISQHGVFDAPNVRKLWPPYLQEISRVFPYSHENHLYAHSYSHAMICIGLLRFIDELDSKDGALKDKLIEFVESSAIDAFYAVKFKEDPCNLNSLLRLLKPYTRKVDHRNKREFYTPRLARFLSMLRKPDQALRKFLKKKR